MKRLKIEQSTADIVSQSGRPLTLAQSSVSSAEPLSSPNAIIKWNPRREDKEQWLSYAEQHGCWTSPREGKRIALFSTFFALYWLPENGGFYGSYRTEKQR